MTAIQPDAVLLDLKLPDIDGLELLLQIPPYVPVIIMTAKAHKDVPQSIPVLLKPFGIETLFERIADAIEHNRYAPFTLTAEQHLHP